MNKRRRKIVPISPELLYDLFTVGAPIYYQCIEGLPTGARFIAHDYDPLRDVHYLVFEADEWEPVPFNQMLPELTCRLCAFHVAPLLEQAEMLIAAQYGDEGKWLQEQYGFDATQWLKEWRTMKDRRVC